MNRIKDSEIAEWRAIFAEKQNNECALCGTPLDPEKSALDHCHESGNIRGTLCTMCNQIEGRVLNWLSRSGKDIHPADMLANILAYWRDDYRGNPLHPTHYLPEEVERQKLKRKLKRLKAPHAISKTKARIEELNFSISLKIGDNKPFIKLDNANPVSPSSITTKMLKTAESITLYGKFSDNQLKDLLKYRDKISEEKTK